MHSITIALWHMKAPPSAPFNDRDKYDDIIVSIELSTPRFYGLVCAVDETKV